MSNEVLTVTKSPGIERFEALLKQHKAISEHANRRKTALTYGPLFVYSLLLAVAFTVYPLTDALLRLWGLFVSD